MIIRREGTTLESNSRGPDAAEPTGVRTHDFWRNRWLCVADVLRDSGKCYHIGVFSSAEMKTKPWRYATGLDTVDVYDAEQIFMAQVNVLSLGLSLLGFGHNHKTLLLSGHRQIVSLFIHYASINLLFKYN